MAFFLFIVKAIILDNRCIMDITQLKEKLDENIFTELEKHLNDITSQRDAARKLELETRNTTKAQIEELSKTRDKILERLGVTSLEEIENLPDAKGQAEASKQFEVKLKRLERDLSERNKHLEELRSKHERTLQQIALNNAMSKYDFIDGELVTSYVSNRLVQEGEQILYKSESGNVVPLEDGLALLVKSKPSLIKNQLPSGSGYRSTNSQATVQRNPWEKKNFNLTEQLRILSDNPNLAIQLKAAAGV